MQSAQELQHAIQRHESYVAVDPANFLLRLTLGDLYHQAGRVDEAAACYGQCVGDTAVDAVARSRLASVLISQHRFPEAEQSLRKLIDAGEPGASLLHNLGLSLYYQSRWEDARRCFSSAIEQGLVTADAFAYLTRTLHHLGMMSEAIAAGRQWAALARDGKGKSYLSLLYMDDNDVETSRKLAREALAQDPGDINANVVAGMAAAGDQEVGPARLHFETALRQDRENGRAWLGLGLVQFYEQEHGKAIESLANAARLFPGNSGILVSLGWAKLAARDPAGAEDVFEEALRANRTFAESHGGLASALAFQQKFERAEHEIALARRLDPAAFGAEFAETTILAARGQTQVAADLFEQMLKRSPPGGILALIDQLRIYAIRSGKAHIPGTNESRLIAAPVKQSPGKASKPKPLVKPSQRTKSKTPPRRNS